MVLLIRLDDRSMFRPVQDGLLLHAPEKCTKHIVPCSHISRIVSIKSIEARFQRML